MENKDQATEAQATPAKCQHRSRRVLVIVVVGAVLAPLVYFFSPGLLHKLYVKEDPPPAYTTLKTGGTSVVSVIVANRWRTKYQDKAGVEVEYDSTGSTAGLNRLIKNEFAISFTHAPMSDEQRAEARAKGGEVVHIPVVLCGVAPVYNVKELKDKPPLNFTGEVLADIFLGKISRWDDPALKAINPGVVLPATKVAVVHRKDSSGTTLIFTEYLAKASRPWREKFGRAVSELKWPVGAGAERNLGVAEAVDKTEGAIGYVDRLYTTYDDIVLQYGAVQNKDKTAFVRAEPDNMTAAAHASVGEIRDDLTFDLTDKPGKDSYPISGVVYAVCYQTQPEPTRKVVVDFLRWATHEGQDFARPMNYAPLPPEVVARIDPKLESIRPAR